MVLKTKEQRAKHDRKHKKKRLRIIGEDKLERTRKKLRIGSPAKIAAKAETETPQVMAARERLQAEILNRGEELTDLLSQLKKGG